MESSRSQHRRKWRNGDFSTLRNGEEEKECNRECVCGQKFSLGSPEYHGSVVLAIDQAYGL